MKFLYNAPAILHKGALILGDTHFGMEMKLRGKGIYDDQFSMRIYMKLKDLVVEHKAKKVIFLGDVKENITMLDSQTRRVLAELSELAEITIVRGNHDGGIERFLGAEVCDSSGMVYDNLGLAHGHSWPAEALFKCRYLVMGHQHPMVQTRDTLGKKHTEPAWLIAPPDVGNIAEYYDDFNKGIELILMPAFNPLVGSVVNSKAKKHLGPVLNNKLFKLDDALVFRLDGTGLGRLESQG